VARENFHYLLENKKNNIVFIFTIIYKQYFIILYIKAILLLKVIEIIILNYYFKDFLN